MAGARTGWEWVASAVVVANSDLEMVTSTSMAASHQAQAGRGTHLPRAARAFRGLQGAGDRLQEEEPTHHGSDPHFQGAVAEGASQMPVHVQYTGIPEASILGSQEHWGTAR